MRKGYSITGASFNYPFSRFLKDIEDGKQFQAEFDIGGQVLYPKVELNMLSEAELQVVFDNTDCMVVTKQRENILVPKVVG